MNKITQMFEDIYNFTGIPTNIKPIADGRYIPNRSQVIKNKRRKAHLLRTKRGAQKYQRRK